MTTAACEIASYPGVSRAEGRNAWYTLFVHARSFKVHVDDVVVWDVIQFVTNVAPHTWILLSLWCIKEERVADEASLCGEKVADYAATARDYYAALNAFESQASNLIYHQ